MNENKALGMFRALSEQTRLRIVKYLVECGNKGAAAGEIGQHVGAASSRASFHLAALEKAGVVTAERQSRHIIYRAANAELGGLVGFLLNDCCARDPEVLSCCGIESES